MAGIQEDGSWIRLYPIPFRMLEEEKKYEKFSWIEIDVERNSGDFRPESYRPINLDTSWHCFRREYACSRFGRMTSEGF